jgi:hypothetical protein
MVRNVDHQGENSRGDDYEEELFLGICLKKNKKGFYFWRKIWEGNLYF